MVNLKIDSKRILSKHLPENLPDDLCRVVSSVLRKMLGETSVKFVR